MLASIISSRGISPSGVGRRAKRLFDAVVNAPKSTPTGTCSRFFVRNARPRIAIWSRTSATWKTTVARPISSPVRQVIVYGIELTGETPRSDFTDSAIPSVMTNSPSTYIPNRTAGRPCHSFSIAASLLSSQLY